jgi:hypothetical protein
MNYLLVSNWFVTVMARPTPRRKLADSPLASGDERRINALLLIVT